MVVVTLVGWLAWRSLGWPLVHDAPLMHYVAWRIAEGAVPYRDLFDMNFPGVYLLHLLVVRTLGAGDLPWRLFDLAWLASGRAGGRGLCRAVGTAGRRRRGRLAGALSPGRRRLAGGAARLPPLSVAAARRARRHALAGDDERHPPA